MPDDPIRSQFSALRALVEANAPAAREQARALLEAHVAQSTSARQARRARRPWRRGQRRWVASLAGVLVVAGAGAGAAAILLRTEHTGHLPVFTARGTLSPQFRVGGRGVGYCWTASLATQAADAYRCMQGNTIHDPCFAPPRRRSVVACFIDPWHPVTLLTLSRPLPRHGPAISGPILPWAIETMDGRRCTFLTGATAPMGGQRINYGCIGGSLLIGDPNTRHPLWTIHSAAAYHPDALGHPAPLSRYPLARITETIP
jgi:hypothetical protein